MKSIAEIKINHAIRKKGLKQVKVKIGKVSEELISVKKNFKEANVENYKSLHYFNGIKKIPLEAFGSDEAEMKKALSIAAGMLGCSSLVGFSVIEQPKFLSKFLSKPKLAMAFGIKE